MKMNNHLNEKYQLVLMLGAICKKRTAKGEKVVQRNVIIKKLLASVINYKV